MTDYGQRNYSLEYSWAASTTDYLPAYRHHLFVSHDVDGGRVVLEL